eukprot:6723955-Pyramimonas_sp.AAC.1
MISELSPRTGCETRESPTISSQSSDAYPASTWIFPRRWSPPSGARSWTSPRLGSSRPARLGPGLFRLSRRLPGLR